MTELFLLSAISEGRFGKGCVEVSKCVWFHPLVPSSLVCVISSRHIWAALAHSHSYWVIP